MRRDNGGGNGRRWLANHSYPRASGGEVAAGPWLRRRNHCRADHSSCELLRHSTVDHTCNFYVDHGRRRGKTFHWNPVDSGRTNCLGMGFHSPGNCSNRLCARTHNWSASLIQLHTGRLKEFEQFLGPSEPITNRRANAQQTGETYVDDKMFCAK